MNVLSLFDGAACCMVCLKRAGIPIENYYGADIKKCAVRCEELIAKYYGVNHIQLGDGWHCGSIQWLFDKLKEISEA